MVGEGIGLRGWREWFETIIEAGWIGLFVLKELCEGQGGGDTGGFSTTRRSWSDTRS